jgi:small subunit ribosomal protein S6
MKTYRYESVIIFNSDLDEDAVNEQLKKVEGVITAHSGAVESKVIWGRRELAYKIKKRTHGIYVVMVFNGDRTVVADLDRQLKINETVLRHIIVEKNKFAPDWTPGRKLDDTLPMDGFAAFEGVRTDDF